MRRVTPSISSGHLLSQPTKSTVHTDFSNYVCNQALVIHVVVFEQGVGLVTKCCRRRAPAETVLIWWRNPGSGGAYSLYVCRHEIARDTLHECGCSARGSRIDTFRHQELDNPEVEITVDVQASFLRHDVGNYLTVVQS